VEEILERLTLNIGGSIRHAELEGRDHLVVPTTMIVEGVLNGSRGPLLYPADELESSVPAWNHKPIVVYHPREGSACDPAVLNTRKIGVILNTAWDAPKLRTESWIDVLAANRVDKRIIESLEENKTVEVSTGVYTKNKKDSGEFNSKKYDAIATNYRPDHLAILPDQIGACSIADGAGLLQLNAAAIREGKLDRMTLAAIMSKTGLRPVLTENEKSHELICSEIYSLIQARYGWDVYVDAVFDSYFIFCKGRDNDRRMYKLPYTSTDKETTIGDEAVEVYRKISYLTVNGEAFQTVTNQKADKTEDVSMNAKQAIDALIANGGYEESDRKTLEGFPEAKLVAMASKLKPVENKDGKPDEKPADKVFKEPTQNADTVTVPKKDWERVLAMANNQEAQETSAKTAFVELLVANERCVFTKEHLMKQDMPTLQGIAQMIGVGQQQAPTVNYFGAQGGLVGNRGQAQAGSMEDEEVTPIPTMNFDDRKIGAK
jgi:hypothetical protein